ncbi:MAG TPA: CRISPR-associated RAMP protein Csx7 [Candidatus Nitrosotenuis sp.]|nr:CRISPR-associated RAMP protein Csx7 [Candidatus Nitrosotenuis sp.]
MTAVFYDRLGSRLELEGWLVATSALRIGEGRSLEADSADLPVVRDALGRPYIPGSSFKGCLRAHAEAMLRTLAGARGACDPLDEKARCVPDLVDFRRSRFQDDPDDQTLTQELYKATCWACRIFGSPWMQSRVQVRDLEVDGDLWAGQFQIRNGVAIDRETETASEGKLYDFEVVPAGVRFRLRLLVENPSPAECGLLMMALRCFETGEVALGGGRSRGLGACCINWERQLYIDLGDRAKALQFFAGEYRGEPISPEKIRSWVGDFQAAILEA